MKRIESPKNERVKEIKKLHTKKRRDQTGLFLIEGAHLIEEALKQEGIIQEIFIVEQFPIPKQWNVTNIPITYVTDRVLKEMAKTETPQGIVAICKQFSHNLNFEEGRFLLIDRVQDPGNVGTMIRTADAVGLTAVILGEGSVDLYNDKVIRATQGSLFHIPVLKANLNDWIEHAQERIKIYGTSLTNGKPFSTASKQDDFALIVGNEGEGVSQQLLQKTSENLYIPIYGKAESLNVAVATGILLYHLKK